MHVRPNFGRTEGEGQTGREREVQTEGGTEGRRGREGDTDRQREMEGEREGVSSVKAAVCSFLSLVEET